MMVIFPSVTLTAVLAVTAPTPVPTPSTAEATYVAALERMRATREPPVAVYRAALSVPGGFISAQSGYGGVLFLRFGLGIRGPDAEDFFVRTSRDSTEYTVERSDRHMMHSHVSLLNATWQGIDSWIRYGYEGPDSPPPATPAPKAAGPTDLRVISVVESFGLAFYNASDGGTERCVNGDAGQVIRLSPRGDAMQHPLRAVTIDDATGLFCTMHFDVPAMAWGAWDAIAHVALHLSEVDGYYVVQDEIFHMEASGRGTNLPDQQVNATMNFGYFVFPTPKPSASPGQ
jgi:hypothetical protein